MAGTPTEPNASAGFHAPAHQPDIHCIYQALLSLTASLGALLGGAAPKSMALADVCSECLTAKAATGARDRYLGQLRLTMVDLRRVLGPARPPAPRCAPAAPGCLAAVARCSSRESDLPGQQRVQLGRDLDPVLLGQRAALGLKI